MMTRRSKRSLVISVALFCLLILAACGGVSEDKSDQKANVNASTPSNDVPIVNSASPTASQSTTVGTAIQPVETQKSSAQNRDNKGVASVPKPQIGSGGEDFFLFTQTRGALDADPELKAANLVIEVNAGTVTLSGTVANTAQKSKAEQRVRAVKGVKAVKNQLRISS